MYTQLKKIEIFLSQKSKSNYNITNSLKSLSQILLLAYLKCLTNLKKFNRNQSNLNK
jgi:hypothetical protein